MHVSNTFSPIFQDSDELLGVFGYFLSGGYNGVVNSASNQINGKSAWVGNSGGFVTTEAVLPTIGSSDFMSFGWAIYSDSSVLSQGWWIDSVTITPSVDLEVAQSISSDTISTGSQLLVTIRNLSSTGATNVRARLVLPTGFTPGTATASTGTVTVRQNTAEVFMPSIPFGSTQTAVIQGSFDLSKRQTSLEVIDGLRTVKRVYGVRVAPFTPNPALGITESPLSTAFDFFGVSNDACEHQAINLTGKIAVVKSGGCSIAQKANRIQAAGGIALVVVDLDDDLVIPSESGAGISIPVLLVGSTDSAALIYSAQSAYGSRLIHENSLAKSIVTVRGDQFDPEISNNFNTASIDFVLDSDGDGTPDISDRCATDPNKVEPGACGCGTPDSDLNQNTIVDCQVTIDLKQELVRARFMLGKLRRLTGLSKKARSQELTARARLNTIVRGIDTTARLQSTAISARVPTATLLRYSKTVRASVTAVTKARDSDLSSARTAALKALKRLSRSLL
jgi:hypothetical protein